MEVVEAVVVEEVAVTVVVVVMVVKLEVDFVVEGGGRAVGERGDGNLVVEDL